MPLIPAGLPAIVDRRLSVVRFAMEDGAKLVTVLVSKPALEDIVTLSSQGRPLDTFKANRKNFERIASDKYDRGYVEEDGTICIRAMDLPLVSTL
jgi:Protein of unknown function (DUF1488)